MLPSNSKVDHIVQLILKEARRINNPDPIARIYSVYRDVGNNLGEVMDKIRADETSLKEEGG